VERTAHPVCGRTGRDLVARHGSQRGGGRQRSLLRARAHGWRAGHTEVRDDALITCAQAAVATVASGPDGTPTFATVLRGFPPDVPFRLGTSAFRVMASLRAYGVPFTRIHSGWLGRGAARCWERLATHLDGGGRAIVCVDTGRLGGMRWAAHWAVAWRLDASGVHLRHWSDAAVPVAAFRRAWACRHLPWPHHHLTFLVPPESVRPRS
jgi:hypothetical protein